MSNTELKSAEQQFAEQARKFRDRQYAELKADNFELYKRCLDYAEGINLRHGLSAKLAAEIEAALIGICWENLAWLSH